MFRLYVSGAHCGRTLTTVREGVRITGFPEFDPGLFATDAGGTGRGGRPRHGSAAQDWELPGGLDGAWAAAAARLGVDGLAVSLIRAGGFRVVLGGTGRARWLELAELTTGEGPATDAARTGRVVFAGDLTGPGGLRWPGLTAHLTTTPARGVSPGTIAVDGGPGRAVIAIPLRVDLVVAGAVTLLSAHSHGLDETRAATVGAVADAAARILTTLHPAHVATAGPGGPRDWLRLHRAVGMVGVAAHASDPDALDLLRAAAFADHRPVTDVAADVFAGRLPADLADRHPSPPTG